MMGELKHARMIRNEEDLHPTPFPAPTVFETGHELFAFTIQIGGQDLGFATRTCI